MKKAILIVCILTFSCKEINTTKDKKEDTKTEQKSELVEYTIKCNNRNAEFKVKRYFENVYRVYSNVPLDRGNINGVVNVDGVTLAYAQKYEFSFEIAEMFDEKEVYDIMIKRIKEKYCEKKWR